jgi:ribonuclease I
MKNQTPGELAITLLAVALMGILASYWGRKPDETPPMVPPRPADSRHMAPTRAPAQLPEVEAGAISQTAARTASFDFYLLALSWHPAFCAEHLNKPECRVTQPHPLSLHGLWPEKLAEGAYPHDCPAPRLELDRKLRHELADYMPGVQSNLDEHEWRTHGACSGLDADDYFQHALELARALDAAMRPVLTTAAGREGTPAELRAAADAHQAGLGATLTLQCRMLRNAASAQRGRPFLIEVRQCVDNDGPHGAPGTLLDCASVNRRDQGCGKSFQIAELR